MDKRLPEYADELFFFCKLHMQNEGKSVSAFVLNVFNVNIEKSSILCMSHTHAYDFPTPVQCVLLRYEYL